MSKHDALEAAGPATVSLPVEADLAAALRDAVAAGDYASEEEALRDALDNWLIERTERRLDIEHLRRLIDEGLDSGDPVDGEAFFDELLTEIDAKIAARA